MVVTRQRGANHFGNLSGDYRGHGPLLPTPMDVSAGASPARDFVHYSTVGVSGLSSAMEWFRCIPSPEERPEWTYWHCLSSVK